MRVHYTSVSQCFLHRTARLLHSHCARRCRQALKDRSERTSNQSLGANVVAAPDQAPQCESGQPANVASGQGPSGQGLTG
jgi:hypothetical protein